MLPRVANRAKPSHIGKLSHSFRNGMVKSLLIFIDFGNPPFFWPGPHLDVGAERLRISGGLAFTAGSGLGLLLRLESDFLSTLDLQHAGCVNGDFRRPVLEIPHRVKNRLFCLGGNS
jgi:hypothetical protein